MTNKDETKNTKRVPPNTTKYEYPYDNIPVLLNKRIVASPTNYNISLKRSNQVHFILMTNLDGMN